MIGRQLLKARSFLRQQIRSGHDHGHDHGGVPGESLPFSIENRYKLTALFAVFFSSGFALPFLIVRHQILRD